MGIVEWFKHLFRKEEVDTLSLRIETLYKDLRNYYSNNIYNDPDFRINWHFEVNSKCAKTEIIKIQFNSLLSPITLELTVLEHYQTIKETRFFKVKETKRDYILRYRDKNNKGFTIYTQPMIINSDFDQDEIDLALFEIEDYLRDDIYKE